MKNHYSLTIPVLLALLVGALVLNGCNCNKNSKIVDVSGIDVTASVQRFDQDLMALDTNNLEAGLQDLLQQYPDMLPMYCERIMGFGNINADLPTTARNIRLFLTDPGVQRLYDSVQTVYPDITTLQQDLTDAYKHYRYYYPNQPLPKVRTFISYFGYGAVTYDTLLLAIGLDMYLGRDFGYPNSIPKYVQESLGKEYVVPQAMKVLGNLQFNYEPEANTLLSNMIANGKKLYLLDMLLPQHEDYAKIDYTPEKLIWCRANEPEIWNFFIDKELLYTAELREYRQFITPGPTTSGMPPESPGNVGTWTGWQIVRRYMKEHPETTYDQLMALDGPTILAGSKYKPKHGEL